jgi:hypothetical protein
MLPLFEGNSTGVLMGDIIHGVHYLATVFRNHVDGTATNAPTTIGDAIHLNSNNRFFNLVGNVLGSSNWTNYQWIPGNSTGLIGDTVFLLGWQGNGSGQVVSNDPNVSRTLLRWGNWDSVTNSTRFVASEVPSLISNFSNPVPASQTLPASFYLSGQPNWWSTPWGTPKWPAIGPDVTGGNITNSPTGGHADKIPARLCFENLVNDPAYPTSNPRTKLFSADTCYLSVANPTPTPAPFACHNLDSTQPVPNGYAASYNPFTAQKELLLSAQCNTSDTTVTLGNGNMGDPVTWNGRMWVWNQGYQLLNNTWQPVTYSCSGEQFAVAGGAWCRAEATGTLDSQSTAFLGYTCQWHASSNSYKCGCTDTACTQPLWHAQQIQP